MSLLADHPGLRPFHIEQIAGVLRRTDTLDKMGDLMEAMRAGISTPWPLPRSIIVTNPTRDADGRLGVFYHVAAGVLAECLAAVPSINQWARDNGASFALAYARKGWKPHLERMGWRVIGPHGPRGLQLREELA